MPDVSINGIEFQIKGSTSKGTQAIENLANSLTKLTSALKTGAKATAKFSAMLALTPVKKGLKDLGAYASKLKDVAAGFKRILGYRIIRSIIKEITQGFAEGIKHIYGWSKAFGGATINGLTFAETMDGISTSLAYFKNSIGAAVAPLISALAPALDFIVDKVVALINVINQLFALLAGGGSWNRAIKKTEEYEDAISGAGGAAKEALKYLAPFDELNRLPDDRKGGGGGGSGEDYSGMFEEVTEFTEGLKDFADSIRAAVEAGDWQGLGTLLGTKVNELVDSINFAGAGAKVGGYINAWFTTRYWTLETINFQNIGAKIAEFFNNTLDNIDFDVLGRTITQKFTVIGDLIVGAISELDGNSVGTALGDFISGAINQVTEFISKIDWGEFVSNVVQFVLDAIDSLDIGDIISAINGLALSVVDAAFDILTDENTWALIGAWFYDLPAKIKQIGIDIANSLVAPIVDGINSLIDEYNASWFAEQLGTIDKINFQLIPDVPEEELTKYYDSVKAEIEAKSRENPTQVDSKANLTGYERAELKTPVIDSKANFRWYSKAFTSGTDNPNGQTPLINSRANFKWYTNKLGTPTMKTKANFNKYTTSFSSTPSIKAIAKINRVDTSSAPAVKLQATAQVKAKGGVFQNGNWSEIPQFAGGGSLFVAGEAGPEVVGHFGGRTEVLNQSQMASAIASGVSRYLGGNSDGGASEDTMYRAFKRALSETDFGGDIELDGETLFRSMVRRNRANTRMTGVNALA